MDLRIYLNFFALLPMAGVVFGLSPAKAAVLEGTREELQCVFDKRVALSLTGLIDPVPVYAEGCIDQFKSDSATDFTHGGIDLAKPVVTDGAIPPASEWPTFSVEELNRIECHIGLWSASNPGAPKDAKISIELSKPC